MGEESFGVSEDKWGQEFGQEESGMFLAGREGAGVAVGDVVQRSGSPVTADPLVPALIPSRLRSRRASPALEGTEGGPQVPVPAEGAPH